MAIEVQELTDLGLNEVETILDLMGEIFGKQNEEQLKTTISAYSEFHLVLAYHNGILGGFKLGRRMNHDTFYSWLGGVKPQLRGLGLAKAMMACQHDWCRREGYRKVQTKTQNQFREMLLFNIKSGFQIIGTEVCPDRDLKILMEKSLVD